MPHASRPEVVIVGTGQVRRRPALDGPWEPVEPAGLMAAAMAAAFADTGAAVGPADVDSLACVPPVAWGYHDLVGAVVRLGDLAPERVSGLTVAPGGNAPVELLGRAVNRILDGDSRVAVVTGGEALYSRRRARREGVALTGWTPFEGHRDIVGDQRPLTNALEDRHGLRAPVQCYPLFENALRVRAARTIGEHQQYLGRLMAAHTAVAAANPYAWFPAQYRPEQLVTPTEDNRWVCFPYPKRLNAIMEVDQAAAVVVMSAEEADRRAIPVERRVRFLGGAGATDAWTPTERTDFVSSPAYRVAATEALRRSRVDVGDISAFDLYSCFPAAVEMAMDVLGLDIDDPRPRTVTGGLAYAGGPGNAYSVHGLAAMADRLRGTPDVGLVSALGMTATKHAVCLLAGSAGPGRRAAPVPDETAGRWDKLDMPAELVTGPPLVDAPEGPATVETYTVEFDRAGDPATSVVVLRLPDGRRSVAQGDVTPSAVRVFLEEEGIGRAGVVTPGDVAAGQPNRFVLA